MPTDKKINELVLNQLTKEQYDNAKSAGQINADEFYMITDEGGGGTNVVGVTATLSASGWTEQSDGSYAQTVSVAGVTADNQVIVDVALSGSDMDADIETLKAWGCVNRASQAVDNLTFYCYGDTPTVSISLNVVVM